MPTVPLTRGRITRLDVHHFATGVRILVYEADTLIARIVLNEGERDHLVRVLTTPDPGDASLEELYRRGEFASVGRLAARGIGDVDDRLQDAVCVLWLRVKRRAERGKPTTPALMRTMVRQTVVARRAGFVPGSRAGLDALGPFRAVTVLDDDSPVAARTPSPETTAVVQSVLARLGEADRTLVLRRAAGDTLAEIAADSPVSLATLHRREQRAWDLCHAL